MLGPGTGAGAGAADASTGVGASAGAGDGTGADVWRRCLTQRGGIGINVRSHTTQREKQKGVEASRVYDVYGPDRGHGGHGAVRLDAQGLIDKKKKNNALVVNRVETAQRARETRVLCGLAQKNILSI